MSNQLKELRAALAALVSAVEKYEDRYDTGEDGPAEEELARAVAHGLQVLEATAPPSNKDRPQGGATPMVEDLVDTYFAAQLAHVQMGDLKKAVRDGRLKVVPHFSKAPMFHRGDVIAAFTCLACGAPPDDREGWEDGPDGALCPTCGESLVEQMEREFPEG